MKKKLLVIVGAFVVTVIGLLAACATASPRATIGRPVDDGPEPMSGVILGCYCYGQDVWCRGANGQSFKVAHCPSLCLNAMCQ